MPEVNIIIKRVFEGSVPGISAAGNKTYTFSINGHLSQHGVTRPLKTPAVITVKDKLIKASSSFTIRLSDFKIKIPTWLPTISVKKF